MPAHAEEEKDNRIFASITPFEWKIGGALIGAGLIGALAINSEMRDSVIAGAFNIVGELDRASTQYMQETPTLEQELARISETYRVTITVGDDGIPVLKQKNSDSAPACSPEFL